MKARQFELALRQRLGERRTVQHIGKRKQFLLHLNIYFLVKQLIDKLINRQFLSD